MHITFVYILLFANWTNIFKKYRQIGCSPCEKNRGAKAKKNENGIFAANKLLSMNKLEPGHGSETINFPGPSMPSTTFHYIHWIVPPTPHRIFDRIPKAVDRLIGCWSGSVWQCLVSAVWIDSAQSLFCLSCCYSLFHINNECVLCSAYVHMNSFVCNCIGWAMGLAAGGFVCNLCEFFFIVCECTKLACRQFILWNL